MDVADHRITPLTRAQAKERRRRAVLTALALAVAVAFVFALTVVRLGPAIFNRPL